MKPEMALALGGIAGWLVREVKIGEARNSKALKRAEVSRAHVVLRERLTSI